jgi:hypothetical protein
MLGMPATTLTPEDLEPFGLPDDPKTAALIEDALGMAKLLAPCIFADDFDNAAAAKTVLRQAVVRWNDAGTGASQQLTALGFSQSFDTRQARYGTFLRSETDLLKSMCGGKDSSAYTIDTAPYDDIVHADVCAVNFGANYCSCGADLTGSYPLWETAE